jgi:alpha-L-fucosidase
VRELCTRYGKIDIFWWDALWWGNMFTAEMWDGENITRLVRELQPGIIQNNRCCVPGDFDTPEGRLGHFQNRRAWESCICLTDSWSYSATPAKPVEKIVRMIVSNACGDGNLLLSWGAHWDGAFDEAETQRLREVADWLDANGASIFQTRGGPWKPGAWGGSTHRDDTIYLHITDHEGDVLDLPALPGCGITSAAILGGADVPFESDDQRIRITLPEAQRDPIDTIVVLRCDRSVSDIEPIATSDPSLFDDAATYGSRFAGKVGVQASSLDASCDAIEPADLARAEAGDDFGLVTDEQAKPWVQLDLGDMHTITGVRVERMIDHAGKNELVVSVSADGQDWQEADRFGALIAEVAVNAYRSGAWVPGQSARYVRIAIAGDVPARLALRHCSVYTRSDG